MTIKPASGTKDLNPQQVEENQILLSQLSNIYKKWGYEEVSPPKVERIQTLIAGGGISTKDILKIVADEPVGLRPEMTASIIRIASTRFSKKYRPLRLWANGTVFKSRDEIDGKISIEESLQSSVELFGTENMLIEVELLNLLLESLKSLNLNNSFTKRLLVGHSSLMNLILSRYENKLQEKINKAFINFDLVEFNKLEISSQEKNNLLSIQKLRGEPEEVLNQLSSIFGENDTINSLKRLFNIIKPIGQKYNINIQLDPTYKPLFDLYTGIIFELVCEGTSAPVVIARGGRYDELVRKFGSQTHNHIGGGFAFYIDKIRELNKYATFIKDTSQEKVLVAFSSNKSIEDALEEQRKLHEQGHIAVLELSECIDKNQAKSLLKKRKCEKLKWISD